MTKTTKPAPVAALLRNYRSDSIAVVPVANCSSEVTVCVPEVSAVVKSARTLHSYTMFSDFIIGGPGSTFFADGVIIMYSYEERRGGGLFSVVESEDPRLCPGAFVHENEFFNLLNRNMVYVLRTDRTPVIEEARVQLFGLLTKAVNAEGEYKTVLTRINEAKDRQATTDLVARIHDDMESGQLLTDPLQIFAPIEGREFGFIIRDKPMVFRTGLAWVGQHARRRQVHSLVLVSAPLGTDALYQVGTFVYVAHLFDDSVLPESVVQMTQDLRRLFTRDVLPEAMQLAVKLW